MPMIDGKQVDLHAYIHLCPLCGNQLQTDGVYEYCTKEDCEYEELL